MAGDLVVRVLIKSHKLYERRGADLFTFKKITLLEALTGVTLEMTHSTAGSSWSPRPRLSSSPTVRRP